MLCCVVSHSRETGASLQQNNELTYFVDICNALTYEVQHTTWCVASLCSHVTVLTRLKIGQALRLAIEQGIHTNMQGHHLSEHMVERCKETWWTVYILDRQMTSLMGVPISISDDDVTAPLPFAGSARKKLALSLHIKLSKATAIILQSKYYRSSYPLAYADASKAVYARTGGARKERLLVSMKEALKSIAEANDERNEFFPLDLDNPKSGICRLSAYLHIFHHQVSVSHLLHSVDSS